MQSLTLSGAPAERARSRTARDWRVVPLWLGRREVQADGAFLPRPCPIPAAHPCASLTSLVDSRAPASQAVSYFKLAADLGDVDAQQDVAFAFANGKGCKKDLKEAARYYRLAIEQGAPAFGLSWVYKDKYLDA